jgi:hypothetical protein
MLAALMNLGFAASGAAAPASVSADQLTLLGVG